jgi:DNA end-binding protein Ku
MPPRAMWKGAISFGLVTIPVAVYPATEEKSLRFNQLHDEDMGRIRYKRVCSVDGEEVDFEHIVKGYEVEKDRYVVLTDDDLDAVPVESSRAIDIQQFVDLDEIDPILFKKSYYLVPDETGAKAYALLRKALADENKVGIAKVSFRDKEHLAALRFKGDVFVLETMYWPDEIRATEFDTVDTDGKVRANEVEMARQLIESLSEPWEPERYKDEYREALLDIVEKKLAGEPIEVQEEAPPARVVDLMAALKASVEAAKARTPSEKPVTAKRSSPGKPRAKSSTAKTSTAKKPTAKKPTAKKQTARTSKRPASTRKKAVGE